MKRNYKSMLLVLIVLMVVLLIDTIIVHANEQTGDVNILANEKLNYLVESKLGKGTYQYETLYDFNDEKRYVLVTGENCYLIFDNVLNDYVEFSVTDKSFYEEVGLDLKKIYLAPTYYYYKNNGEIYDLYDKQQLTENEIHNCNMFENQLKNAYEQSKLSIENSKTGDDDPVYIANRYYYDNLRYNIGSNNTTNFPGSCTYVALGMMLTYYDSIINDNVIAETYDVSVSKSFSSYSSIDVEDYTASPGINDTFHAYLIQYGRNLGVTGSTSNSISISDMDYLLEEYFDERNLSIDTHVTSFYTNKVNFCRTAINNDRPVIISISGTDTSINPNYIEHCVVGYGYDDSGIYAHFGWKTNYHTNTNINNYTINNAFYISFNSNHSHSNNYEWTYNGCSGTICPCGNKTCNHGSYTYANYSSTKHRKTCNACGTSNLENHSFQTIGSNQVCSYCGYTYHAHDYTYTWVNYIRHRQSCSCGVSALQAHVVSPDAYNSGQQYATCLLCGGNALIDNYNKSFNDYPYTVNGSFILPNGVIVLEEDDMEAYIEGNLIFIYPNKNSIYDYLLYLFDN